MDPVGLVIISLFLILVLAAMIVPQIQKRREQQ